MFPQCIPQAECSTNLSAEGESAEGPKRTLSTASLEFRDHGAHGFSAVTDAVLGGSIHFGKSGGSPLGDEHRIVAKTIRSAFGRGDGAGADAFEGLRALRARQRDDGLEPRTPIALAFKGADELVHIGPCILRGAGIARCMHSGRTAEGIDFESCIVCKTIHAVVLLDVLGFLDGVAFDGVGRLGYVLMTSDVSQSDNVEMTAEQLGDFLDFTRVAGGKNEAGQGHGAKMRSASLPAHFSGVRFLKKGHELH